MLAKEEVVVRPCMVVRESLSENVAFEHLSTDEGVSHVDK